MLALLSGLFAQLFASTVVQWVAWKILLYTLVVVVLPIVLNNVFKKIIDGMISLATSGLSAAGAPSMSIQFTEVAGALIQVVGLPAAFAVVMAAVAFKFSLRLIPFIRL